MKFQKTIVPCSRTKDGVLRAKMKSQDILLLLKVVSLSQQANQSADQFPQNWKDWDLTAVLDEGSAHEAEDEASVRKNLGSLPLHQKGMLEIVAVVPLKPYRGFCPKK
jgi:hypothetical protein